MTDLKIRPALLVLLTLLATAPVAADTVQLAPGHPDHYVVQKGDTLWDISGRFLVKPWRWPELWKINPQIDNPHLIYPGDTVRLIYEAGQPQLMVERGTGAPAQPQQGGADTTTTTTTSTSSDPVAMPRVQPGASGASAGRDLRLQPQIQVYQRSGIPTLPLEHIQQFLQFPMLVEVRDFELRPYIVDIGTRTYIRIGAVRDRVYVRGDVDPDIDDYTVFTLKAEHEDPDQPGVAAVYEVYYAGELRIIEHGDPAIAIVTHSEREFSIGDRLYPTAEVNNLDDADPQMIPHAPARDDITGRILSIADGRLQVAEYQVLLLDIGEEDGVDAGTVLGIRTRGWRTQDDIAARQRALRSAKAGRVRFEHEEDSAIDRILSSIFTDSRDLYLHVRNLRLDKVVGVPIAGLPETVDIPGSPRGTVMVFRSFPKFSYALVLSLAGPTFIADQVHAP